jgi:clan AA aspartic protease
VGKVVEKLKLVNPRDREAAEAGTLPPDQVRTVTIDALVDTGATMLSLPEDVVDKLGLPIAGTRRVKYADGRSRDVPWVGGIWIELVGRGTFCNALVERVGAPPLIGQIPLEELDLIVDPKSRSLSVNPLSPDAPMMESVGFEIIG